MVTRQEHRADEKLFVDYAGHTVGVVNRDTGELREARVFVAVPGASNYVPLWLRTDTAPTRRESNWQIIDVWYCFYWCR